MAATVPRSPHDPTLAARRADLVHRIPWSADLLERVESDGFQLNHARAHSSWDTWFLRVGIPDRLQDRFGTAPEMLLLIVRGQVQARDLVAAAIEARASGLRLDLDLVVVADEEPRLAERLKRLPGRGQRVPWEREASRFPPVEHALLKHLPQYDLFEERDPVRGRQVLGRDHEIAMLTARVEHGDAVGVFGLRKVGKTTLVRAVTDVLDPMSVFVSTRTDQMPSQAEPRSLVVWLDAERVLPRTQQALYDALADRIMDRLVRDELPGHRRPGSASLENIDALLKSVLLQQDRTLCIVIDEYDLLFEGEDGEGPMQGLAPLFRMLRGCSQETGRVSLILIGRDPEYISEPRLSGVTNPLLGWFIPFWIGPIPPPRDTDLLRRIGRRVGLDIGRKTAELARKWTGGHPLLHRQFGSASWELMNRKAPPSTKRRATDPICVDVPSIFRTRQIVRDIAREILDLLSTRYPDAREFLLDLAIEEDTATVLSLHGGPEAAPVQTLRNFGLIVGDDLTLPEFLTWYIRSVQPGTLKQAVG